MAESFEANDFSIFDTAPGQDVLAPPAPVEEPAKAEPVTDPNTSTNVKPGDVKEPDADALEGEEEESPVEEEPKETAEEEEEQPATKQYDLSDDDMVAITQDGKTVYVPWKEHKGNVMRQADYTRKLQRVSEAATLLQQRENSLIETVTSKEKLARLYFELHGEELPAVKSAKPAEATEERDELVTTKDLKAAEERAAARAREELRQAEAAKEEARVIAFKTEWSAATEKTLDAILKDYPETLANIPHVDGVLRRMAAASQPASIQATQEALVAAAKELDSKFRKNNVETKKQEAVKKAAVQKQRIEPKGGNPPAQPKKSLTKADGKIDWADDEVVAWIQSRTK